MYVRTLFTLPKGVGGGEDLKKVYFTLKKMKNVVFHASLQHQTQKI